MITSITVRKDTTKCDQNQTQELTPLAGEESPRGVEKPGGIFSFGGAPCTLCGAEKPGGFFSGPVRESAAPGGGSEERGEGVNQNTS